MIASEPQSGILNVSLKWNENDIQPVGRLAYVDRVAHFEYADEFRSTRLEISPIHHRIPDGSATIRPYEIGTFEGLHGVFHDSLPDSWGRLLVARRARELGIDPATLTPLDRLAWVGAGGIGALCYEPAIDVWHHNHSVLDLDAWARDAHDVLEGRASDVIAELGQLGGSPGGARPKAMIAIDAEDGAVYGQTEDDGRRKHFLVKFRGTDDPVDAANIEKAYAAMAEAAGVRVPSTRLIAGDDGTSYFASQRFDRVGAERFHTHTASGLLYADYRLPSLDYRDLIALTRVLTRDKREVVAMYSLAVFNILANNRDDHARQFTFLMTREGEWALAPAYDLTFSPGPGGEHSTSVLGRGKQIAPVHLVELGKSADLSSTESEQTIQRVLAAVADWNRFACDWGVGNASRARIGTALAIL